MLQLGPHYYPPGVYIPCHNPVVNPSNSPQTTTHRTQTRPGRGGSQDNESGNGPRTIELSWAGFSRWQSWQLGKRRTRNSSPSLTHASAKLTPRTDILFDNGIAVWNSLVGYLEG